VKAAEKTLVVRQRSRGFPAPGTSFGSYRLVSLIGQGGIGLVYLAEHVRLKRRVALKILKSELASSPEMVARFFGEARAVNEIAHENIVQITDFIEGDGSVPNHYIMEYLEGATLHETLEAEHLSIDRVLAIGAQIACALNAVHAKRIIHRDLKPDNVFLVADGRRADFVKLLDFGAAKLTESMRPGDPITKAGVLVGTPQYMSPEQILGDPVDHRTDLYALGAVLFEMAAGRPVFLEDDLERILLRHVNEDPLRPSRASVRSGSIPRALDELILECLQKVPEARPASAAEVHHRLERMLEARKRRRAVPAIATACAAAAVLVALIPSEPVPPPIALEPIVLRSIERPKVTAALVAGTESAPPPGKASRKILRGTKKRKRRGPLSKGALNDR